MLTDEEMISLNAGIKRILLFLGIKRNHETEYAEIHTWMDARTDLD